MKRPVTFLPDTNAIVRYLVRDDPKRANEAQALLDQVRQGNAKAILLESVVAECMYVLTKIYKVPKDQAAGSLIDLLHYRGIANEDRQELISALELYAERSIDIVDCMLLAKATAAGNQLFTFDAALNKLMRGSRKC
ncbi:MAG: PIN domain-containing protein [Candidatus Hydrogenedentes bacterium]|nr:PIN domain-containing protein [Candidatus Hydrogenedentota bacterium]